MKISVQLRAGKKRDFVLSVSRFFAQHLGLNRSTRALKISIVKNYRRDHGGADGGVCLCEDEIELVLDADLTPHDVILTLSHEMIHVKQIARGLLKYVGTTPYWCGKNAGHFAYQDRPWEVLAYAGMESLIENLPRSH